ncbi:VWA domain-containing protein [candidate division KSB1 bacterium]|nr:VWA domain-containing protein [candidate division KSB1 bacterium]NIR69967.1 VWA domain-containing protein [candidate division KSB1 bacterium]NIS25866.1 VWA domain-containing protein [candidate division KSB1 bacterium]NIT72743.1 VWA domain-containing protein [candidate division KSB1 bacterium]NIU26555.1 VWA domain-containing protein [candidate division KSB1 bacterium]
MTCSNNLCVHELSKLLKAIAFIALGFGNSFVLFAQNPNSGTTTTGQILTVNIVSPADGTTFPGPPPCDVPVKGLVTLSAFADTAIKILYAIDVSGSTADPFNFPPIDLNDDGVVNEEDDFNEDGTNGDILDAEIAGALALSASIDTLREVNVGVVAYASNAASADMSPVMAFQNFTSPQADANANGVSDVEEVLRSLDSELLQGGSIDAFTPIEPDSLQGSTNFETALSIIIDTLAKRAEGEKALVYFISDGFNEIGGPIDDEISRAAENGIVINTIGITQNSSPEDLGAIAEGTGGQFFQVDNPGDLRVTLPEIPAVGIEQVAVNNQQIILSSVGTFSTTVSLAAGTHQISATAVAEDQTEVTASVNVTCAEELSCEAEILSPEDDAVVCGDSVNVTAVTTVSGGMQPIRRVCTINGVEVASDMDTIRARIGLLPGEDKIKVQCSYVDAQQNQTSCADSITIRRAEPPTCTVEITAPQDSLLTCANSMEVSGTTTVSGGIPPFEIACQVNEVVADVSDDSFSVNVSLTEGENVLVAMCTVTDSCGNSATCTDTIRVFTPEAPECTVKITAPEDRTVFCEENITVVAEFVRTGGAPPFSTICEINGIESAVVDDGFVVDLELASGENLLVASCTVEDSCGNTAVCRDSITVFFDDIPPSCTFALEGKVVKGTFFDDHSGVGEIVPKRLRNARLVLDPDPFPRGTTELNFSLIPIDSTQSLGFSIDVFDTCGNKFNCDPVVVQLSTEGNQRQFEVPFPKQDRYFQLTNRGLTEIRIDLNGNKFTLTSDAISAETEMNTFLMPTHGVLTIDLLNYLKEGENRLFLAYEGPQDTQAELLLLDQIDHAVDFTLELETLPETFQLAQNYPNPFNPTTKIQFDIPLSVGDEAQVQLKVYNLLGELVQVLVHEKKSAGRYTVEWNGQDEDGRNVASGIYIYQLEAGEFKETRRMVLLR